MNFDQIMIWGRKEIYKRHLGQLEKFEYGFYIRCHYGIITYFKGVIMPIKQPRGEYCLQLTL